LYVRQGRAKPINAKSEPDLAAKLLPPKDAP
jgi:hypothetical protein